MTEIRPGGEAQAERRPTPGGDQAEISLWAAQRHLQRIELVISTDHSLLIKYQMAVYSLRPTRLQRISLAIATYHLLSTHASNQ